jgi:hypothetical protein
LGADDSCEAGGALRALALAAGLAFAACATALAAPAGNIDLLRAFGAQLPKVKRTTTVLVLLPRSLPLGGNYKVYASFGAARGYWELSLAGAPHCRGANACFVASFEGKRGAKLPGRANLRLAGGDPAVYHAFSCGASCSPTSFWFTHDGVLYGWQVKDLPKAPQATLARLAAEAIAAGPR